MKNVVIRALVSLITLAVTGGAVRGAQEPLSVYETATVWARPVSGATASVTILDREAIEALGVRSVAELIRFVPGLDVTPSGPRGGLATAQIRGGDPNFTIVMVDGVPLNDLTDQVGGAVNLNSLTVAHVERVEVVRGPLSSVFGSAGLSGVINIITRRGSEGARNLAAEVAVGDDSVLEGAVSLSGGGERTDRFLGLSWEQEQDRIADDEFRQLGLVGNLSLPLGESARLRLSGRLTAWESEDYPDASGGVLGSRETRRSEHDEQSLGLEVEFGPANRRHRVHTRLYRHRMDRTSPAIAGVVPPSTEDTTFTTGRLGWSVPLLRTDDTRLDAGIELAWEKGNNTSLLMLPPAFGGDVDGSYRIERTVAGAFVEWSAERGRLLFDLGARFDMPEGFANRLSPRVGLGYRLPGDATRLRISAGRGFKLPSFFALASPTQLGGNPSLLPEVALGADVGLEHRFEGANLNASLTLFYFDFEDLIDFDFGSFSHINVPGVESRGVELAVGWSAPQARVKLEANLTHQDVDVRGSTEPLRHRPEWIAGTRLTWQITDRVRWELDGQSVSESFDQQIPVPSRDRVSGHTLLGTAVSCDLTDALGLGVRVDNLTDKDYETFIGFPGASRSLRIGLRYRP